MGTETIDRIEVALDVIERFGTIDGSHHKTWVIDQVVRALTGRNYDAWVAEMNSDPEYDNWDVGIAP